MMLSRLSYQESGWPCFDTILRADRDALRARYETAAPFPHLVLDGLFPPDCLRSMVEAFEATPTVSWRELQSGLQRRRATVPGSPLPPRVQEYFNILNSGPFTRFLSDITGIGDLIPDPALYGGGMHEVEEGGAFEVHIDFERHPRTFLNNRLVVITYLNDNWTEADGGNLELWYLKPRQCGATVAPIFGRTVIVGQSPSAAHGHLQPIRKGRRRRSVTAYFYTNGLTRTIATDALRTVYIAHKGHSLGQSAELFLRLIVPPFILTGAKTLRNTAEKAWTRSR
jgi:hypothetical protein